MVYIYKPKSYTKKAIVTGGAYAEVSEVKKQNKKTIKISLRTYQLPNHL